MIVLIHRYSIGVVQWMFTTTHLNANNHWPTLLRVYIIVVYGSYELSFSFWFMITAYDQEIEKDRSIKQVK